MAKILITTFLLLTLGAALGQGCGVAFRARLPIDANKKNVQSGSAIVLPRVMINRGDGYNSATGKFTAPIGGIYHITASTKDNSPVGSYVRMALMVNEEEQDYAGNQMSRGPRSFLSVQAVVELSAGDKVWLKHVGGQGMYHHRTTDFMGFLVESLY